MESIEKWFKMERDPLYLRGQKKGIAEGEEKKALEIIKALLLNTNHSIPEIARLVNVSEGFVLEVRSSL